MMTLHERSEILPSSGESSALRGTRRNKGGPRTHGIAASVGDVPPVEQTLGAKHAPYLRKAERDTEHTHVALTQWAREEL